MNKLFFYLFLTCFSVITSCSTKKNTVVSRAFHNLTSHYNGFYYAEESIKEGVEKIESAHKDDFTRLLPIFIYADSKEAKNTYAEMDKAILKSSKVIQRHAIVDKNDKEIAGAVKWIDDNYLTVGKAQFYKNDYLTALETFEYVAKTYKNDPNSYKAYLWMMRCYNELGSMTMVEPIIDMIKGDKNFPRNLISEFAAISADYYLKRENYPKAIKELSKAAAYTRKKKERVRYTYILAQLYQQEKNNKKASVYYGQVVGMHPEYDMTFSAKINIARLYDAEYADSKKIKKDFRKMLRDEKNAEYRDQIYYALAQIEKKENNIPGAIDYLKKSVKVSVSNTNQKAISYLMLGDIHFDMPDYKSAQVFYDSTMLFLDKSYPNYEHIANKQKSLTELVKNLTVIEREDSLQKLTKLSEKEIDKIIRNIIFKLEEEEFRKEQERLNQQNSIANSSNSSGSQQQGQWYFYNQATISAGMAEFTKRWGDRKLEDNWRRSNKENLNIQTESTDNTKADTTGKKTAKADPTKTREYYLKNIPFTEDSIKKSNERMVAAYYEAGVIYREDIMNDEKSAETFEELLQRFPENKHKLSCYYQLYRLYTIMEVDEKANYYKNILLTKYPDTEYAKLIRSPDYAKRNKASKSIIEQIYSDTYDSYTRGEYAEVIARCNMADTTYYKNFLMPKFEFLKALAVGKTRDIKAFENALTGITVKYPKDEVTPKAQEIIDYIKRMNGTQISQDTVSFKSMFIPKMDTVFYWVSIVKGKKAEINTFKIAISDINSQYYGSDGLSVTEMILDDSNKVVTVKNFPTKAKGMNYFDFMKGKQEVFRKLGTDDYTNFIISPENLSLLYKEKNLEEYMAFFQENFLK